MFEFLQRKPSPEQTKAANQPDSTTPPTRPPRARGQTSLARSVQLASLAHASEEPHTTRTNKSLVELVLHQELTHLGLLPDLLHYEVKHLVRTKDQDRVQIDLTVLKWNEKLLKYAPLIQSKLLRLIDQFDQEHDHRHSKVCWHFDKQCVGPFFELPAATAWSDPPVSKAQANTFPQVERRKIKRAEHVVGFKNTFSM